MSSWGREGYKHMFAYPIIQPFKETKRQLNYCKVLLQSTIWPLPNIMMHYLLDELKEKLKMG